MKPLIKYFLIFLSAFAATAAGTYIAVILVASDSQEVVLPDLKGKNIIYVLETLTALNLNPKLYGTEYNTTCPRYHVISQDPEPGSVIKKGRDVVIYISKGEKQVNVPDFRHMFLADAKILIEAKELKTGFISKTYSNNIAKNQIITQYPDAYTEQERNSEINLLISQGKKLQRYAMPDLYSIPLKDAKNIISALSINISSIGSDNYITLPQNVIINQTPEAGSIVTKETKISLIVNRKKQGEFLDPDVLESVVVINYSLEPGFLKKHVRITADLYGSEFNLVDKYAPGSENIYALVPGGIKTKIKIYIDNELVKTQLINPWKTGNNPGEEQ
ncbi:MAG: PASTA domain-containing protein [Desulfobacteraceae bacterium]|nr:PASTA domain-containing protein [Desulfobacteraceae bacterium]